MLIQRPYNITVDGASVNGNTIDGLLSHVFSWQSSGGIQAAFRVQILLNSSGAIVFDSGQQQSYALQYTMPANSITNGQVFQIQVIAYDLQGNSATSYTQLFQTSATPVVTMAAITSPVNTQAYTFSATYSQAQNVPMASYIAYLYDNNKNLIGQSAVLTALPLEYTFSGLQTGDSYYIEIECTSNLNVTGSTGMVSFSVSFAQPTTSAILTATSNDDAGSIELAWNVFQIIGSTDITGTITYPNNDSINLTGGNNVWWNNGINIAGNFTLKLWIQSPNVGDTLMTISGGNGTLTLVFGSDNRFHVYKNIIGGTARSHYASQPVADYYYLSSGMVGYNSVNKQYYVGIQQINNDSNVYAQILD